MNEHQTRPAEAQYRWGAFFAGCLLLALQTIALAQGSTAADWQAVLRERDITKDGYLSGTELRGFEHLDTNGDKEVTKAEFVAGTGDWQSTLRERDVTQDGYLSGTEMRGLEHLDTNGDKRVTKAEFGAAPTASSTQTAPPAPSSTPVTRQSPPAAPTQVATSAPSSLLGGWKGMTRQQTLYEPMFTFTLQANGIWTDLTWGEKGKKQGRYSYDPAAGKLTLYSASKGDVVYTFVWRAASAGQKERLVQDVDEKQLYRAMVCYRYRP